MTEFRFYLSDTDFNRLFAIKDIQKKDDLTGNEFAAELLHDALVRLFPAVPQFDDFGYLKNSEAYKGK